MDTVAELFQNKFRKAVILMALTVVLNLCLAFGLSLCSTIEYAMPEFKGYMSGTLLSMVFSIIWVLMVRKVSFSNPLVLFSLSLGAFPIKIVVFAVFAFGGLLIFQMNRMFFGVSFLLGTVLSLFVEVWFIITVNKIIRKTKKGG